MSRKPLIGAPRTLQDTSNLEEAKELYSDGATCFVGHFPPVTGDQCMLWVTTASKDAIPPKCEDKFDEKCGGEKYELYDESSCQ